MACSYYATQAMLKPTAILSLSFSSPRNRAVCHHAQLRHHCKCQLGSSVNCSVNMSLLLLFPGLKVVYFSDECFLIHFCRVNLFFCRFPYLEYFLPDFQVPLPTPCSLDHFQIYFSSGPLCNGTGSSPDLRVAGTIGPYLSDCFLASW